MQQNLGTTSIRNIEKRDDKEIAKVIRTVLKEFGANKAGTVYYDETTDALFELFKTPGSVYFIVEKDGEVVGGGGIFPSAGLPKGTCELVKMYLAKEVRGVGLGRQIIQKCLQFAADAGYENVYLETMPELKKALATYEKFGFKYLNAPVGDTGHFGCELWMLKELEMSNV